MLTPNQSIQFSVDPVGLAQQLLNKESMCQSKFEYFLLEMHDKIIHNLKICLKLRVHSVIPIQPHDYLSTPWMVQLTFGGRYRPH